MEQTIFRIKQYSGWIAAAVGVVLAWFSGFELVERFFQNEDYIRLAAHIYVFGSLGALLIFVSVRQYSTIRKEKYANVTTSLHCAHHEIRNLQTFINAYNPGSDSIESLDKFFDECKILSTNILDFVNSIFTTLTGTHCRACIKLMYNKNDGIYIYTLSRDKASYQTWSATDQKRRTSDADPLSENLQMARLFSAQEEVWHYLCNDLTKEKDFKTTSVAAYAPDRATRLWTGAGSWPLPYRSTLTVAIRQGHFDLCRKTSEVVGFLAVDSESRGVFEERWDTQLLFSVADALYHSISLYLDIQNRASNARDVTLPTHLQPNPSYNVDANPERHHGHRQNPIDRDSHRLPEPRRD